MRCSWGLLALTPLATAGCTILLDTEGLYGRDAAPGPPPPDAGPAPDAVPVDADWALLTITSVSPTSVLEGTGEGGARPVVVIVEGDSIRDDVVISAAWADGGDAELTPTLVGARIASSNDRVAIALAVPVNPDLAEGATRDVRLTFMQDAVMETIDVTVTGLDELALSAGNVAVTGLDPLYSQITIDGSVHFTGTEPAVLRATSTVTLDGVADANASGRIGGVHGCDGGTSAAGSGCGSGGGGQGADSAILGAGAGGGGGGFGSTGGLGGGDGGGTPGMTSGDPMLTPLVTPPGNAGNRGNGGGGGGTGNLGAMGGNGGGGGGVLEISAGGNVTVAGAATIRVRANGGAGAGAAGGGGGGSGGAILIRSGGAIASTGPWIEARGGNGANATNDGGNGGVGRIRVDAAAGTVLELAAMATSPPLVRGPGWDVATPSLFASPDLDVTMTGHPGRTYGVRLNDTPLTDLNVGLDGTVTESITLVEGANSLCAVYTTNADATELARPEATSCIEIVYLP